MKNKKIAAGVLILVVFFNLILSACTPQEKRYSAEFLELFNTVGKIVGYAPDAERFKESSDFIYERLEFYHQHYNAFKDFEGINNIKTINDNAGIRPIKVDPSVIELLEFCKEGYRLTDGKVNIAMGSVLKLWHDKRNEFMYDAENAVLPKDQELKEASEHSLIEDIIIDREAQTVYLADPQMRLDVGAIAKGYAVQRVVDEAKAKGIDHIILSIGGNVATIGTKPSGELWQVGVQDPDQKSADQITPPLMLQDHSLVSSGDYERYYVVDGVPYSHIIDPKTLYPPRHFRQVSIIGKDSALADLYSTALFIMPLEEGRAFIEKTDAEAMWVLADGSIEYSDGFRDFE